MGIKGIQGTLNRTYRQLMGNGVRYVVPKFQRDYTWEAEQWDDLWNDAKALIRKEEEEHYMGNLVLQTTDEKEFQIIDGQQRLTTLSILTLGTLKRLNDLIADGTDSHDNARRKESLLNSYIGYIDPVTLISTNKLKLNRNSDDYYREHLVLLKDPLPSRNINTSEAHMRECFIWYYERIKEEFSGGKNLAEFIDHLVDKLFFTVIEVADPSNAFKVFETLNSRGVQLSSSDLLKNYLFSVADETKPHASEIEELENIWSKFIGKLGDQRAEDYLRYYWNSKNKPTTKPHLFKTVKSTVRTKPQVFELARDLRDTADLYMAVQNPEDAFWNDKREARKILRQLKLFQTRQAYSLLLAALKALTSDDFLRLSKICCVVSFRHGIIGGLNPNEQEAAYNSAALKITANKKFDVRDFQSIYVSDARFESDFSTKEFKNSSRNHKIIKYILTKIERAMSGNEIDPESDVYTVEHILPEHADKQWGEFSFDEINRSVYKIGNFTLLEKKLNQKAAQLSYESKKAIYADSNCQLTKTLSEHYESWNEEKIGSRQRTLAKQAKAIWKIQELSH